MLSGKQCLHIFSAVWCRGFWCHNEGRLIQEANDDTKNDAEMMPRRMQHYLHNGTSLFFSYTEQTNCSKILFSKSNSRLLWSIFFKFSWSSKSRASSKLMGLNSFFGHKNCMWSLNLWHQSSIRFLYGRNTSIFPVSARIHRVNSRLALKLVGCQAVPIGSLQNGHAVLTWNHCTKQGKQ